jgi:ParB/RepB/Spo0J family partition protein
MDLSLDLIIDSPAALRTLKRNSLDYKMLRDSIIEDDVLFNVIVRESKQQPGKYEILDGMQRIDICRSLGHKTIRAEVKNIEDSDLEAFQILCNSSGVPTTDMEYARAIKRMLLADPEMTGQQLSHKIKRPFSWIKKRLKLLWLEPDVQRAVDRGQINLSNAGMLAKMPPQMQLVYVAMARKLSVVEFRRAVLPVIKAHRNSVLLGKLEERYLTVDVPACLRSLKSLRNILDNPTESAIMVVEAGCETPLDGFLLGVKYALKLDPASVERERKRQEKLFNRHRLAMSRRRQDFQFMARNSVRLKTENLEKETGE